MRFRNRSAPPPPQMTPQEADNSVRHRWLTSLKASAIICVSSGLALWVCSRIGGRNTAITMVVFIAAYVAILPTEFASLIQPHRKPIFDGHRRAVILPGSAAQLNATLITALLLCVIGITTIIIAFAVSSPLTLVPIGLLPIIWAIRLIVHPFTNRLVLPPTQQWIRLAPYGVSFKCLNQKTHTTFAWSQEPRIARIQGAYTYIDYIKLDDFHLEEPLSLTGKPLTFTQLDRLLDHFNTHPADRQLLALPEGAQLVQTLLDTTPRP